MSKMENIKKVASDILSDTPDVHGLVIVIQEGPNDSGERIALHGDMSRIKAIGHLSIIQSELIDQYRGNNQHILEEN